MYQNKIENMQDSFYVHCKSKLSEVQNFYIPLVLVNLSCVLHHPKFCGF